MAIRFQCNGCSQPIEVDDDQASRLVICCYCRRTITVPFESTLPDAAQLPVANPPLHVDVRPLRGADEIIEPAAARLTRRTSITALILLAASCGLIVAYHLVLRPHANELRLINDAMQRDGFRGVMQAQQAMLEKSDGALTWFLLAGAFQLGGGVAWIAALVVAILALRRPREDRTFAIAALVATCVLPIIFCCGGAIALSSMAV